MSKNHNVPQVRFKGFNSAWEQRKLNTFSTYSSSPLTNNDINENGEYDLYDANGIVGKTNKSPNIVNYISIIKDGAGVGRVRKLPKNTSILGTMGAIIPNNSNYDFLYVLLENTEFNKLTSGGTIPHIYFKQYSEELYYIPELSEQQQIGAYFRTLDHLITLHQRKCDSLKKTKKAMLQKMFPKSGSRFPEIRFNGFTDAWEQRKFGKVFNEYSEKNHEEVPPLTIIQGQGTLLRSESDRNLQYDKAGLKNYKLVNKDDFILHLRSFEGGLEKANSRGIVSPAYHIFHGEETDTRFYYPFFRSHYFINVLLKPHVYGIRDGKSIDIDGMKNITIPYPPLAEQTKIGDYFQSLDTLITLHQRKLETLKKLKKSMLQKMFV